MTFTNFDVNSLLTAVYQNARKALSYSYGDISRNIDFQKYIFENLNSGYFSNLTKMWKLINGLCLTNSEAVLE